VARNGGVGLDESYGFATEFTDHSRNCHGLLRVASRDRSATSPDKPFVGNCRSGRERNTLSGSLKKERSQECTRGLFAASARLFRAVSVAVSVNSVANLDTLS